ncbi:MAG: hypothetical protein ACOCWJ_06355, partial [Verrucomicrobiota bacterium]
FEALVARREAWPNVMNELAGLRPRFLWLTEIRPVVMSGGETMTTRERRAETRGPAFPFMAGAGDQPRETGRRGRETAGADVDEMQKEVIVGMEIQGHSITVAGHSASAHDHEEAAIPPDTMPREPRADVTEAAPLQLDAAPAEGDAEQDIPEVAGTPALEALNGNVAEREQSPVQQFLSRLQNSELVDAENTSITSYNASETVPNLNVFGIRIRFAEPIELKYE